ncbi:MAG: phosphate butyryltransferase [Deltaproteobacteria bacterium]|jgi:phosphate butyryltransferase|nr:phosphate butyryltransferase [Deltaproteobacteria bacterium]
MKFSDIVTAVKGNKPKTLAVAMAEDSDVLEAVVHAKAEGLANPILVGAKAEIEKIAKEARLDLSGMDIVDEPNHTAAVRKAVMLVGEGKADVLMKGLVHTADFLRGVLNKEWGLATGRTISMVGIVDSPKYNRLIFITDPAIATYPDLPMKVDLINNAARVALALGVDKPKVACLCAVETVNPKMQATLDAAALAKMGDRGQFRNCVVDGPFALDNALSQSAAKHKGLVSPVAGLADILLCHNIETSNSLYKSVTYLSDCETAGMVLGAKAPLVITSRADTAKVKFNSIACALLAAGK